MREVPEVLRQQSFPITYTIKKRGSPYSKPSSSLGILNVIWYEAFATVLRVFWHNTPLDENAETTFNFETEFMHDGSFSTVPKKSCVYLLIWNNTCGRVRYESGPEKIVCRESVSLSSLTSSPIVSNLWAQMIVLTICDPEQNDICERVWWWYSEGSEWRNEVAIGGTQTGRGHQS